MGSLATVTLSCTWHRFEYNSVCNFLLLFLMTGLEDLVFPGIGFDFHVNMVIKGVGVRSSELS